MRLKKTSKRLWNEKSLSNCVKAYEDCYLGEINPCIGSNYPYGGESSSCFRRVSLRDGGDRFYGLGDGVWTIKRDGENHLTADLFVAADLLGGRPSNRQESAPFGGAGVDMGSAWVPLLDGGVGCEVLLIENQYTNRISVASHRTTIRGPKAYRALLLMLGFDWYPRKLLEEDCKPNKDTLISELNEILERNDGYCDKGESENR